MDVMQNISIRPYQRAPYFIAMKSKHKTGGFTILELIVVIIIVGLLASLALPRYFKMVEASRAQEAINAMGIIRRSLERRFYFSRTYNSGGAGDETLLSVMVNKLDINDPARSPNAHFNYLVVADRNGYNILACSNGSNNRRWGGIMMTFNYVGMGICVGEPTTLRAGALDGQVHWDSNGPYEGLINR